MKHHLGRAGAAALVFLWVLGAVASGTGWAEAPHGGHEEAGHGGHDEAAHAATPTPTAAAVAARPEAATGAAPGAPAARPGDCRPRDGSQLLLDFFGQQLPPAGATPPPAPVPPQDLLRTRLARGDTELQFLLATVPEPRLGFDGAVESMTRALEAAGYTLDRYALPADLGTSGPKGNPPCYEQYPGTSLFVHSADPKVTGDVRRLLILYVIGETPIAGIHKPAFLRAVQEMNTLGALLPAGRCPSCDEVRLVGPSFSGSVVSLELLIDHFPTLSFNILSGRATNAQIMPLLTRHSNATRHVRYQATVIPDEALQTEFYRYLSQTLGANENDIALVTESSTAYGQAVIANNTPLTCRLPLPPGRVGLPSLERSSNYPYAPRLTLPVPLHISRLHSSLAKRAPAAHREAADSLLPNLTATLPQLLDDTLRADIFPTLSERTLASEDRALAHVLSTIAAEKIHYVGILATDVQDKLFLAYQIRTHSPDVVLFTFESDILYTHPEARLYLKGMLVVSPYPLYTRNQQWTYPFRGWQRRLQFASEADQGVYNATVALLGCPDQLLEYSQAAPGTQPPQSRPAIWISAVGNETVFPLALIKDYKDDGYVYQNPIIGNREYQYSPYQQGALSAVLLILGLVGAFLCVGYFRCYYAPPGELPMPWSWLKVLRPSSANRWQPNSAPAFGHNEARRQPLYMLFVFGPMWVGYILVGLMHFVQLRADNLDPTLLGAKLPFWLRLFPYSKSLGIYADLSPNVLAIGLIAAACQVAFSITVFDITVSWLFPMRRAWLQKWLHDLVTERPKWPRRLFYTSVALALIVGTLVWFGLFVAAVNHLQDNFNVLLFLGRSAHPAVGLSPAMPAWLLIATLQLWGYCNLQRIAMLDKLSSIYIDLIEELADDTGLRTEVTRIAQQLESPGRLGVLSALGFSLMLSLTVLSELMSLEHHYINFYFRFLFAMVLSCTGYAFYNFMRLWHGVRQFLHLLSHHPLAPALERLPIQLSRSLSMLLLGDVPDRTRREAEQQHFHLLMNHLTQLQVSDLSALVDAGPDADHLMQQIVQLRDLRPALEGRNESMAQAPAGISPPVGERCDNGDNAEDWRMVYAARKVVQILKHFWSARPLPGTVASRGAEKPTVSGAGLPANRNTAELYLQLLPDTLHLWLRLCEDFIAIQVASYITRLFPHLRNALLFVTFSFVLVIGAMVSYPFQPQHYLLLLVWLLLVITGPLTVWTLIQMNRDEVLSRLAKSEPGKITWDRHLISQIIFYGILPLLSLAATQFPEVRGAAFSWVETLLKTLK